MKYFTHPPEVYWRAYYRRRRLRLNRVPDEEQACLNCGTKYHGNYCPVCGQSHQVKSLTVLHVLRNLWQSLIMLRKGYAITLLELTGHPGYFMRHYIRGHRVSYVHPFRLLLVLLMIYVLLSQTFMPDQLPKGQSFGFTAYLNSVQTGDWRQVVAHYLVMALQYLHDLPLFQMTGGRLKAWFFQNPALQAITLFPFFVVLSYCYFHSGVLNNKREKNRIDKMNGQKIPGFFETTIKEPLRPLWDVCHVIHMRINRRLKGIKLKCAVWWIRNFGKPVGVIRIMRLLKKFFFTCSVLLKRCLKELKQKQVVVEPFTYDFIEVTYMRGYFTCLLMEVNIVLFFCGMSVTPFNIWVIAGTVWIYKTFFRWRWWDAVRCTIWMYVWLVILAVLFCMIASIVNVINE